MIDKKRSNKNIFHAVAMFLMGMADDNQKRLVEQWRKESDKNERLLLKLQQNNRWISELREIYRDNDTKKAWKKFEKKLKPHSFYSSKIYLLGYAAILMVGIIIGIVYFSHNSESSLQENLMVEQRDSEGPMLILGDGSVVSIAQNEGDAIVEEYNGAKIYRDHTHLDYSEISDADDTTVIYNEIKLPYGLQYSMTLSDGTHVYLNAGSHLRFPVKFQGKERVLELEGEAYFDVSKDTDRPFIVRTQGVEIRVLGTEFNLRSYRDEESIQTTLITGSVEVKHGEKSCRITPGEQAYFERSTEALTTREVDVNYFTAWHRSEIMFRDMPLEEVMRNLARLYNIEYSFEDEEAKKIEFGGCFRKFGEISPIIDMLKRTGLVDITMKENEIYISIKK